MAPASEADTDAPSGFLPGRIVHLHPTLACNLACAHCYSSSAPQQRGGIDAATWQRALPLLRAQGYTQVSLSGGEPLVYPALAELVAATQDAGLRVTMVSNGLLVGRRFGALLRRLDGVAISFDGLAARHDALRGRAKAFDHATRGLQWLADQGLPVAAAVSLTRDALPELPDLADHLVAHGARGMQVRPVARAGRAQCLDDNHFHSDADLLRLYLVVAALQQELAPDVRVHGDLVAARHLWQQRDAYAGLLAQCNAPAGPRLLSDLVNPLVITEQGVVKPVAYDFDRRYDITTLHDLGDAGLAVAALARYVSHGLPAFKRLVGEALAGLQQHTGVLDWFDHLARRSERHPLAVRAMAA